jgi:hypothetical protein
VGDFAGGVPLAVVLGARLRDNGGWFWNPNAAAILTAARKIDAPVGAAEIKNRPDGRCFSLGQSKSSVLTSLVVKPVHPLQFDPPGLFGLAGLELPAFCEPVWEEFGGLII